MKKYYFLLIIVTMFFVSSCATSYQPRRALLLGEGYGYKEARLSDNVFEVSFKGNAFTDMERARDFSLLRIAELMKANGYNYFVVVDKVDDTIHDSSYTGYTGKSGFTSASKSDISEPNNSTTAEGFKNKEDAKEGKTLLESDTIIASIKEKYDIKNK